MLLVEADPAGGTLAAAADWPVEPSLVSLAAAARRGGDPALVGEHCHRLPGGAAVLAAPPLGDQARGALGMLAELLRRLGELEGDVLIDCGRLDAGSPVMAVWERADRPILVARPRLADLQALAAWLEGRTVDGSLRLVTVGDGPYADSEIAETLRLEVLARLPWDPGAADALTLVAASARQMRLAPLVRSVRTLADELTDAPPAAASAIRPMPELIRLGIRILRARRSNTASHVNGSIAQETER